MTPGQQRLQPVAAFSWPLPRVPASGKQADSVSFPQSRPAALGGVNEIATRPHLVPGRAIMGRLIPEALLDAHRPPPRQNFEFRRR